MRHAHDRVREIDRLVLEHVDPRTPQFPLFKRLGGGQLRLSLLRGSETRELFGIPVPAARLEPCNKANPVANGTSEVISLISLELPSRPCIMFNSNGFYDIPHTLFNCTENMGVSSLRKWQEVHFASSIEEVAGILVPC